MNFNTRQLNSAILNALMILSENNKEAVVVAFSNSMSQVACDHDICNNMGTDIARMIGDDDWEGLSNFLDHGHLMESDVGFQEPSLHNKDLIGCLNDYMVEWNISPEVLAEDIGVSTIRGWLSGSRPGPKSYKKLFDYFGIDFTERFAYYTSNNKLMFEGTHERFLNYLGIGKYWFIALERDGKVIKKSLPVAEGECAEYKTYDVLSEHYNANHSRTE